jgi:hypothetical protein
MEAISLVREDHSGETRIVQEANLEEFLRVLKIGKGK